MNEETLNLSIRTFLKMVGVNSQRAIEHAVDQAMRAKAIRGNETFPVEVTLRIEGLNVDVKFDGKIKLE
jgi:hypothetical protein